MQIPVLCLHDIRDDDRSRAADSHFAVNEDFGTLLPVNTAGINNKLSFPVLQLLTWPSKYSDMFCPSALAFRSNRRHRRAHCSSRKRRIEVVDLASHVQDLLDTGTGVCTITMTLNKGQMPAYPLCFNSSKLDAFHSEPKYKYSKICVAVSICPKIFSISSSMYDLYSVRFLPISDSNRVRICPERESECLAQAGDTHEFAGYFVQIHRSHYFL